MRTLSDGWMTTAQAAQLCNVSVSTYLKWSRERTDFPPPKKINSRTFRWSRADLERWLASREGVTHAE